MNKKWKIPQGVTAVLMALMISHPVFADETVESLKKQVDELKAKVSELEKNQQQGQAPGLQNPVPQADQWDPFAQMEQMRYEMGRMFNHAFSQAYSPRHGMLSSQMFFDNTQIEEKDNTYQIKLDIAGFDKDRIDVKVNGNSLSVSGEYKKSEEKSEPKSSYESHSYGKFLNTISIPKDADASRMNVEKSGDQLIITLPKKAGIGGK